MIIDHNVLQIDGATNVHACQLLEADLGKGSGGGNVLASHPPLPLHYSSGHMSLLLFLAWHVASFQMSENEN